MKSLVRILLTLFVLAGILTACGLPAATPSTDEVVNTTVAGTQQAQAGFQRFGDSGGPAGGPDFSQFNGKFSEITGQFARGQMPQARGNVDTFERSLGSRPNGLGGGGPGGGLGHP